MYSLNLLHSFFLIKVLLYVHTCKGETQTGGNIKIYVIDDGENVIGITFTNATYLAKCSTLNHCTYK